MSIRTETIITEDGFKNEYGFVRFDQCKAPEKHMRCIAEWIKDTRENILEADNDGDRAYFIGQLSGFELCLELMAGQTLDSDLNLRIAG